MSEWTLLCPLSAVSGHTSILHFRGSGWMDWDPIAILHVTCKQVNTVRPVHVLFRHLDGSTVKPSDDMQNLEEKKKISWWRSWRPKRLLSRRYVGRLDSEFFAVSCCCCCCCCLFPIHKQFEEVLGAFTSAFLCDFALSGYYPDIEEGNDEM